MFKYKIYGDYGLPTETLIEEFNFVDSARDWFYRYTLRGLNGYISLTLLSSDGSVLKCLWENDDGDQ